MNGEDTMIQQKPFIRKERTLRWSGLQARMTVSYALTTVVAVLVVEVLLGITLISVLTYSSLSDFDFLNTARQTARLYALAVSLQSNGTTLDPRMTFEPGKLFSIAQVDAGQTSSAPDIAYVKTLLPDSQPLEFALLIAPGGQVLASSYPARYPSLQPIRRSFPAIASLVMNALSGTAGNRVDVTSQGRVVGVAEPIVSQNKKVLGAIYVQLPNGSGTGLLSVFPKGVLISALFWLLLMVFVGGTFGAVTTRGLVRRLRSLVHATEQFAKGDYTQRVFVSRNDEVGQLEQQFNRMAQQLVESITQRQRLIEQNARLGERGRLARDLHDSVKQQVFAVSMQLGAALSLFEQKPDAAHRCLIEADTMNYHVQQELNTLIQELRPLALQGKRLATALQSHATTWSQQQHIALELHVSEVCLLPQLVEEALWRITQEALSNIARHSHANRVRIALTCEQGQVVLSITDNGQGFDQTALNGSGVGLHSMQERITALGGSFKLESKPEEGTHVIVQCICPHTHVDALTIADSMTEEA